MKKHEVNFTIDALAFVAFILLVSTGITMYWLLPPGSGHMEIWGMNRHGWGDIHFWVSVSFITLIAVHMVLHWSWITAKFKGKGEKKTGPNYRLAGLVAAFIIILLMALAPFFSEVADTRSSEEAGQGKERTEQVENP